MFPDDLPKYPYLEALYRKNNFGQPCIWFARVYTKDKIEVFHGIVGKTITNEIINTNRSPYDEVRSRINAKRKVGYKYLSELKDNIHLPVEGELLNYLNSYLSDYRTTIDNSLLPMKAKVYDNSNNKVFKKVDTYIGQWKINGLRCFITAELNSGDMFKPIKLRFQSCEGVYWSSLSNLEEYLLSIIDNKLLDKMIDEHYALDGEVYLPGYSVNEINHFVKDPTCKENKLLQFWCYDLAIEEFSQHERLDILHTRMGKYCKVFVDKEHHLNNNDRFILLPTYDITNNEEAICSRNQFIHNGFEGLILRNPNSEYQYGKRNQAMIKFKKSTDGLFVIVDIYPEGIKRKDIPLFLLRNDINDETFEVHIGGTKQYQSSILKDKDKYIGKRMYVEYGERSGVKEVPFHIKETRLV